MIIQQGDARRLTGLPWAAVELTGESRVEEIVLHIARWLQRFDEPVQLLFPVQSRDLDGVKLLSPYLWIRAARLEALTGVKTVMGVQGLLRDGRGQLIPTDDRFVQTVVEASERTAAGWSEGIVAGSFVRILYGRERMLCGWVEERDHREAVVRVPMKMRELYWKGPVRALLNLASVPKREQVYYYSK